MENKQLSRRRFLGIATVAAAGIAGAQGTAFGMPAYIKNLGKPNSVFKGVQIGVITYSFRSMPGSAEQLLQYCLDSNVSAIELMGDPAEQFAGAPAGPPFPRRGSEEGAAAWKEHAKVMAKWREGVSMKKFEQLRQLYNDAGITIYGYKPSALGVDNTDAEVDYACRAAKVLGANQVTVEFPTDPAQTQRLGNIAGRHGIYVGYHGHLQQTFDMWDNAIKQSDYNAANFDMGHYVAAGFDPIAFIKAKHPHIVSMHIKDRKNKENGGANLPWGEGDTPLKEALQLMAKEKYRFPATIELEYQIPEGSDAVREVAKCVEYARKALEA